MELPNLDGEDLIAVDIETYNPDIRKLGSAARRDGYIVGVSIAVPGNSWYISLAHPDVRDCTAEAFGRWFTDSTRGKEIVLANGIYDLDFIQYVTPEPPERTVGKIRDIQIAEPLICEPESVSLDTLSQKYLGITKQKDELEQAARSRGLKGNPAQWIYKMSKAEVEVYAVADAVQTLEIYHKQLPQLEQLGLMEVFDLESDLTKVLLLMRRNGVRVNLDRLEEATLEIDNELYDAKRELERIAGGPVNVNSSASLAEVYDKAGVTYGYTDKGNPSFAANWLEEQDDPISNLVLAIRHLGKVSGTFLEGISRFAVDGRIHTQFHQLRGDRWGTVSGRLSCVDGSTIIDTDKGSYRIDEYPVGLGARVLTHTGKHRQIKRRIFKGVDEGFRISTGSGKQLIVTAEHRILTPQGWVSVANIDVGDTVYVNKQEPCKGQRHSEEGSGAVPIRREANTEGSCEGCRGYRAHSTGDRKKERARAKANLRESPSPIPVKGRKSEPYEREDGREPSQLQGGLQRWVRISHPCGGWEEVLCTPYSNGRYGGCSCEHATGEPCCASHRRESFEQFPRQSVPHQSRGAHGAACETDKITEKTPVGEIQVYDLEVDEDHSYAAGGLFNHNSSLPNLQQIPARNERFKQLLRGLFIPEEGMDWVKGDYSQIEMRVIGHYARGAGAEVLRDRYSTNPRSDFYSMVAEFAGVERQFAKMLALGVSYGMGQKKLAAQMGLRYEDAAPLFQRFHQELPFLKETSRTVSQVAANRGWVKTIMGRRRWFPDPKFSYKGLNAISQGTAADIMKKMLVDCYNDGIFDVLVPHLTVHDEVDASVPRTSEGKEALQEMKMIAESCVKLRVPLILDVETGPNWADVHEVEV